MKKEIRIADKLKGIVQITTADERWYQREAEDSTEQNPKYEFVPSVTWIAGFYPKGIAFYKWLADRSWDEAEALKQAAGDKGSKVHQAIDDLIKRLKDPEVGQLSMDAKYLNKTTGLLEELSLEEWECLMSFTEWYNQGEYEILANEYVVWNEQHNYAGTVDILAKRKSDGKIGIIDVKTSQNIWPEYELQISAYAEVEKAEWQAILQVNYRRNKSRFKFTEVENRFPLFLAARQIWAHETEGEKPLQRDYPMTLELKVAEPQTNENHQNSRKQVRNRA